MVLPPAPRPAAGVGQVPAPQAAAQGPPPGVAAQAAAPVPPVARPRLNPPQGQNPAMANPQA